MEVENEASGRWSFVRNRGTWRRRISYEAGFFRHSFVSCSNQSGGFFGDDAVKTRVSADGIGGGALCKGGLCRLGRSKKTGDWILQDYAARDWRQVGPDGGKKTETVLSIERHRRRGGGVNAGDPHRWNDSIWTRPRGAHEFAFLHTAGRVGTRCCHKGQGGSRWLGTVEGVLA